MNKREGKEKPKYKREVGEDASSAIITLSQVQQGRYEEHDADGHRRQRPVSTATRIEVDRQSTQADRSEKRHERAAALATDLLPTFIFPEAEL